MITNTGDSNRGLSRYSAPTQKLVLALQALQFGFLSYGYLSGTAANSFSMFENLFVGELQDICTETGCWASLAPFVGSLYATVALFCILGLFFRSGAELRLMLVGVACASIFMATSRYLLANPVFYPEGVLFRLCITQLAVGVVVLLVSFLPYQQNERVSA